MTLQQLSQLYYLTREIESDQKRLERLKRERAEEEERLQCMRAERDGLGSQNLDGMPHGTDVHSAVESRTIRLIEQEERVRAKRAAILNLETGITQRQTLRLLERAKLEDYIAAIPDSLTRQIFTARFGDGLTWDQVADTVGSTTVDSVKKTCYRYIEAHKDD